MVEMKRKRKQSKSYSHPIPPSLQVVVDNTNPRTKHVSKSIYPQKNEME